MRDIPFDLDDLDKKLGQVDVCFVLDVTGSMAAYIDEAKRRIREEAERIAKAGDLDIRYAIVQYRDHPPQDSTFVFQTTDFVSAMEFQNALDRIQVGGGGDGPEAVLDGLLAATRLQWRPTADHGVFLVGDAPPHGYAEAGDFWPDGCPCRITAGGVIEAYAEYRIQLNAISIAGHSITTRAFQEMAEGCRGECTEVAAPKFATASFVTTLAGTSSMIDTAKGYLRYKITSGGTDEMWATVSGMSMAATNTVRGYTTDRLGVDLAAIEKPIEPIEGKAKAKKRKK